MFSLHCASTGINVCHYCVLDDATEIDRIHIFPFVSFALEMLILASLLIFSHIVFMSLSLYSCLITQIDDQVWLWEANRLTNLNVE